MLGGICTKIALTLITLAVTRGKIHQNYYGCAGMGMCSVRISLELCSDDRVVRSESRKEQEKVAPPGTTYALTGVLKEKRGSN